MAELVAVQDGLVLYKVGELGVVVDTQDLDTFDPQPLSTYLANDGWVAPQSTYTPPAAAAELADSAVLALDVVPVTASAPPARTFRVPAAVQAAARDGLAAYYARPKSRLKDAEKSVAVASLLASGSPVQFGVVDRVSAAHKAHDERGVVRDASGELTATGLSFMLMGGPAAAPWSAKVTALVADAGDPLAAPASTDDTDTEVDDGTGATPFTYDPNTTYYAELVVDTGDPDSDDVDQQGVGVPDIDVEGLLAFDGENWQLREYGAWTPIDAPDDSAQLVVLDQGSAEFIASALDSYESADATTGDDTDDTDVITVPVSEDLLFALASPHVDWEAFAELGRALPWTQFDQFDPDEVATDPDAAAPEDDSDQTIATLSGEASLVADVASRLAQYLQEVGEFEDTGTESPSDSLGVTPDPIANPDGTFPDPDADSDTADTPDGDEDPVDSSDATPLYLAQVSPDDTTAVTQLLAVIPGDDTEPLSCYNYEDGSWQYDPNDLEALQGVDPPPVVELTSDQVADVKNQIGGGDDSSLNDDEEPTSSGSTDDDVDADSNEDDDDEEASFSSVNTFALVDGKLVRTPGRRVALFQSYESRGDYAPDVLARLAQLQANTTSLVASVGHANEFLLGREVTPKDAENTERLKQYWEHGEGAGKIRWGEPCDFARCTHELGKYIKDPDKTKGYCANIHHAALGVWPGQEGPKGHKDHRHCPPA